MQLVIENHASHTCISGMVGPIETYIARVRMYVCAYACMRVACCVQCSMHASHRSHIILGFLNPQSLLQPQSLLTCLDRPALHIMDAGHVQPRVITHAYAPTQRARHKTSNVCIIRYDNVHYIVSYVVHTQLDAALNA